MQLLGIWTVNCGISSFKCYKNCSKTISILKDEFDNNNIDLSLYTGFNNSLKSDNFKEKKLKCLQNSKKEF